MISLRDVDTPHPTTDTCVVCGDTGSLTPLPRNAVSDVQFPQGGVCPGCANYMKSGIAVSAVTPGSYKNYHHMLREGFTYKDAGVALCRTGLYASITTDLLEDIFICLADDAYVHQRDIIGKNYLDAEALGFVFLPDDFILSSGLAAAVSGKGEQAAGAVASWVAAVRMLRSTNADAYYG